MRTSLRAILGVGLLLSSQSYAGLVPNFSPTGNFSSFTTDSVGTLIRTMAVGADNHAYQPATPLGLLGFDVGVDVTAISVPSQFVDLLATATGQASSAIPGSLLVPKFSVRKGLPWGIDLGFSWINLADGGTNLASLYAGEIKYALLNGGLVAPSLAFRLSGTFSQLWFMTTRTYSLDVVVSKSLAIIEPYAGMGLQFWSGELSLPVTSGITVATNSAGTTPHFYLGAQLKLFILRITGGMDYNTSGVTTYGGKVSLGF